MDLSNKPKYLICPDCKNQSIKLNINEFCSVVKNKPGGTFYIYWYTDCLLFSPVPEEMVGVLSHKYSIMAKGPETNWRMESKKSRRRVFAVAEINGRQVGITFPGFFEKVFRVAMASGMPVNFQDKRLDTEDYGFPEPDLDAMFGFRFGQEQLLRKFLTAGRSGLLGAPTRYGKCLGVDTKLLTADYDIVKVQDVKVGDTLMGPDGTARTVAALGRGKERSYRIIPNKGEPFVCNESHILPLKVTGGAKIGGWQKGDIVFVTVKEYLGKSKTFKHVTKLWYAALEFPEAQLPVDPWVVGVWIGDGNFDGGSRLTKPDAAVQAGLISWAETNGYAWEYRDSHGKEKQAVKINTKDKTEKGRYCSAFKKIADMCCVGSEKRIPKQYLTSSRAQRLELLAGLIDTDGAVNNGMGYEITTKYDGLAEDIIRLGRGLGFRVTRSKRVATIKSLEFSGEYWRLQISGDLPQIPCRGHKKIASVKLRVDSSVTGFTVEDIGAQDYYGVSVDGPDKMFLLWDHLVTHNTTLMVNTARAFPDSNIVVAAPGVDLVLQLYDDFTGSRGIKGREIKVICSGKRTKYQSQESNGITIVSSDSLDKCDPGQVDILIADEPHSTVTASRIHKFNMFNKARRFGFGATLEGRYDGADMLIEGLFGPVLAERTYLEAVAEGAICPLHILFLEVELTPSFYSDRTSAYNDLLFENETMAKLIRDMCEDIIPLDWQTLIFIEHERQADLYLEQIGEEHTIAMAKRMNKTQRKEVTDKMRDDKIKRCLCTDIYVQGVTFPDVRVLINAAGGGDNTSAIQKPGRLAQVRPGKKCGIVIDFMFKKPENCTAALVEEDPWLFLCVDSLNRMRAYRNKGYAIDVVKSFDELKTVFNKIA